MDRRASMYDMNFGIQVCFKLIYIIFTSSSCCCLQSRFICVGLIKSNVMFLNNSNIICVIRVVVLVVICYHYTFITGSTHHYDTCDTVWDEIGLSYNPVSGIIKLKLLSYLPCLYLISVVCSFFH